MGESSSDVVVVKTGVANIASVLAGLRRLGALARLSESATEIDAARAVVLPGVGAFGAGMQRLHEAGLVEVLQRRVRQERPLLAVCVGLQLLCEASEESPGVEGLGLLPVKVTRFPSTVRVPQLGWNRLVPDEGCRLLAEGYAYFANSYRLEQAPPEYACARSEHAGPFIAGFERGNLLACQFHPELSGPWGLGLLRRWLAAADMPVAASEATATC